METLIIRGQDKKSINLLLKIAGHLGLVYKKLSVEESESLMLAEWIDEGMKSENVGRESVMKALGK